MIRLVTDAPEFFSDIKEVVHLFWPEETVLLEGAPEAADELRHRHAREGRENIETWRWKGGEPLTLRGAAADDPLGEARQRKRAIKNALFELLRRETGVCPPWGSLTGIRPTRLLYEAEAQGLSREEGIRWLEEVFYVSPGKTRLLGQILDMQKPLYASAEDEFDLYIGIPFCTTRCSYCSFFSGELGDGRGTQPYLAALVREIEAMGALMADKGMRLRAAYMGGGTPTALRAEQLDALLGAARKAFAGGREWTVEAGRPDTIDRDKLEALKRHGVGRISINPQTFCDETLMRIGRAHTAEQTLEAFALAREMGFDDINMDLICALPGETIGDFSATLDKTLALGPESVTVHTLAIKRSSRLHEKGYRQISAREAGDMVELARSRLTENGYGPYYLYRQKYMAGNLENVGYALPGKACLYNVDNMEETTRILAVGAGAITKWLFPRQLRIERAANVKNIEQYIARIDEMIGRKRDLIG